VFFNYVDLPLVIHLHVLIVLHISCIPLGLSFMIIELLSPAVMSTSHEYRTSFSSFMMWIYGLWFSVRV
jgi:hypothetical protein